VRNRNPKAPNIIDIKGHLKNRSDIEEPPIPKKQIGKLPLLLIPRMKELL